MYPRGAPIHGPAFLRAILVLLAVWVGMAQVASAERRLPGPIAAQVIEVIDGDTLAVRAHIWLDQTVNVRVRIAGVDAPELRSRCMAERHAAAESRDMLANLTADGMVSLYDIAHDKYGGRVIARVRDVRGRDVGDVLIGAGLAAAYDGGARRPWCDLRPDRGS